MGEDNFIGFSDFYKDFSLYIDNPKIEFKKFDIDEKNSVDIDLSLDRAFDFIKHYSKDLGWTKNLKSSLISGTLYHGDTFGNYIIETIDDHNEFTHNLFSLIKDFNEDLNLKLLFGVLYGLRRKDPEDYLYFLEKGINNRNIFCHMINFLDAFQKVSTIFTLKEPLRSRENNLLSNRS